MRCEGPALAQLSHGSRELSHLADHPVDQTLAVAVAVREAARLVEDLVADYRLPPLVHHYLDGRLAVFPAPGHLVGAQHQAPRVVQSDLVRVEEHPPLGPHLVDGVPLVIRVAAIGVHELEERIEVLDGAHDEAPVRVPVGPLRHRVARSLLPVATRCPRQNPVVSEILHLLVDGRAPLLPRGVVPEVPVHLNGEAGRLAAHDELHVGASPASLQDLLVLVLDKLLVAPAEDHVAAVDHDRQMIWIPLHRLVDPAEHEAVLGTVELPWLTCAGVQDHRVAVSRVPAREPHRVAGARLHGDDADVPDVADSSPVTSQPALVIDAAVQREVLVLEALHREPVT
mmetsp:Transcript_123467/g.335296  ORF Transcript_123467/g.335296 Transcript_123467/m.335296 type:complete len:341 (+) Transcript_123467:180-1202(+)